MEMLADILTGIEKACLRSLSFQEMHARNSNIEPSETDTGDWLLRHSDFQDWTQRNRLSEHHGFFWIRGNPGSGKSTLMKKAYSYMSEHSKDPLCVIGAFFFNARGSPEEKSLTGLFRTLLHTLCRQIPTFRALVVDKYIEKCEILHPSGQWQLSELKTLLDFVITKPVIKHNRLILFIDALDECGFSGAKEVIEYFERLVSSAISQGTNLNICLSSRHWPQLTLTNCFQIDVEKENRDDLTTYIRNKLTVAQNSGSLNLLKSEIEKKASGIFLWVVVVVQELLDARGATLGELRQIVRRVPSTLEGLYENVLQNTADNGRLQMLRLFQCVFFSQRPLSPRELRYAIAFGCEAYSSYAEWAESSDYVGSDEQMEIRIREKSKGLLEVRARSSSDDTEPGHSRDRSTVSDQQTSFVQFIHESVRDFLVLHGFNILLENKPLNQTAEGHEFLKVVCLSYLKVADLIQIPFIDLRCFTTSAIQQKMPVLLKEHPLLEYAVEFLFRHAKMAEQHGICQDDFRGYMCDKSGGPFERWKYLHDLVFRTEGETFNQSYRLHGTEARPLHVFSQYGLLTSEMARAEKDVNVFGGYYGCALHAAAAEGHHDAVQILLHAGADPWIECIQTSIYWAISRGHFMVVDKLLKHIGPLSLQRRLELVPNPQFKVLDLLIPEAKLSAEVLEPVCRLVLNCGLEALELKCFILAKCDESILSSRRLLSCYLGGSGCDYPIAKLLLDRVGRVDITPEMFGALKYQDPATAFLLMERGRMRVTESLIDSMCLVPYSCQLFRHIEATDVQIPAFTHPQLLSVLGHGSPESVAFLFERMEHCETSDEMLSWAAQNRTHGDEVMRILFRRQNIDQISPRVMIAALSNESHYHAFLKIFQDTWKSLSFPEEVVVVGLERCDLATAILILDNCEEKAPTERRLVAAARNYYHKADIVDHILKRDPTFVMQESVIVAAVSTMHPIQMLKVLLRHGKTLLLTEDVVEAAARARNGNNTDALSLILQQNQGMKISSAMIKNVFVRGETSMISVLLEHDPSIGVRGDILVDIASRYNATCNFEILRDKGKITDIGLPPKPLDTSAVKKWLERWTWPSPSRQMTEHPQITKKVILVAALNHSEKERHSLLSLFLEWGVLSEWDVKFFQTTNESLSSINSVRWDQQKRDLFQDWRSRFAKSFQDHYPHLNRPRSPHV